jgi:hypothetical protein
VIDSVGRCATNRNLPAGRPTPPSTWRTRMIGIGIGLLALLAFVLGWVLGRRS